VFFSVVLSHGAYFDINILVHVWNHSEFDDIPYVILLKLHSVAFAKITVAYFNFTKHIFA